MQQVIIVRASTAGGAKASGPLLQQLGKSLEAEGAQLASKIKVCTRLSYVAGMIKGRVGPGCRHFGGGLRRDRALG